MKPPQLGALRLTLAAFATVLAAVGCASPTPQAPRPLPPGPDQRVELDLSGAPTRGPIDAPVTIVEFSDFRCPYCRMSSATLDRVHAEYPTQVRHVYVYFPVISEDSGRAAIAAEAAHRQGRFWDFRDILYSLLGKALKESDLRTRAEALGMDSDRFTADLRGEASEARVNESLAQARRLGMRGTPNFLINGRLLRGAQPFADFERRIEEELAQTGP